MMNELKEEGNKHFKQNEFDLALSCYTNALSLDETKSSAEDQAVLHKNMAACHLKMNNPQAAAAEASLALDYDQNDVKALFRRCQALELLDQKEEAYKDVMKLVKLDPKNKAVIPIAQRLSAYISERSRTLDSTEHKVSSMFELAFDNSSNDPMKQQQALSNILVLAREPAGAEKIFKQGGIPKLNKMLDSRDVNLVLNSIRTLASLAKYSKTRAYAVLGLVGLVRILAQFGSSSQEVCHATSNMIQAILNGITNLEQFREDKAKHELHKQKTGTPHGSKFKPLSLSEDEKEHVDKIFEALVKCINTHKISAHGRDCVLELLIRNIASSDGLNWTRKFLETDGSGRIMEVAGMMPGRSTVPVSSDTRMHCSALLSKIWDDTVSDQQRDKIRSMTDEYFVDQFTDKSFDSKLDAVVALSCLLQGPTDIGNSVLNKPGVLDMLVALAESKETAHQLIAVEALVHATSKKEKCKAIVDQAIPVLKQLYKMSPSDNIKVRALVGMCKISSSSGIDASEKALSDESALALSRACRKFLANTAKDVDLRKWAVEGLAYLTLDAEIKEELVNDPDSLKALVEISQVGDGMIVFPAASIFVNLMNAYDKPEVLPEMKQLAEYAKQKMPEEHPKDKEEFVKARIETLMKHNVGSAVVALCKVVKDSEQCKELLSRIFHALILDQNNRGRLVQQGAGKVLIPLALENSIAGKGLAAQCLAKLAITMNPEVVYPGQRVLEVVRPLLKLLHPERTALQNFEALMALTNITSVSDSARQRVVAEKGLSEIEVYMTEEHEMLKRAACECICNLMLNEEAAEAQFGENDRIKLLLLYCGDEDPAVQRACCGALAILSGEHSEKLVPKITAVNKWEDIVLQVLVSEEPGVQHRATHFLSNLMENDKEFTEKVVQSQLFEILMAITKQEGDQHKDSRKCAESALESAAKYGFAKHI